MSNRAVLLLGGQSTQAMAFAYRFGLSGYSVFTYSEKPSFYRYSKWIQKEFICSPSKLTPDRVRNDLGNVNLILIFPMEDEWQIAYSAKFYGCDQFPYTPFVSEGQVLSLANKKSLVGICNELSIPVPAVYDHQGSNFFQSVNYPVIVKPNFGSGARGFSILNCEKEIKLDIQKRIKRKENFYVQKYLSQNSRQFKYFAMCWQGKPTSYIIIEKLKYYPIDGGSSVIARTIVNNEIRKHAEKIIDYSNWSGFIDFDFIENMQDECICVLEVNPRPPACVGIAFEADIDFIKEFESIFNAQDTQPKFHFMTSKKSVQFQYLGLRMLSIASSSARKIRNSKIPTFKFQESPSGEFKILLLKSMENLLKLFSFEFLRKKFGDK